jgi:hypothetical protein
MPGSLHCHQAAVGFVGTMAAHDLDDVLKDVSIVSSLSRQQRPCLLEGLMLEELDPGLSRESHG